MRAVAKVHNGIRHKSSGPTEKIDQESRKIGMQINSARAPECQGKRGTARTRCRPLQSLISAEEVTGVRDSVGRWRRKKAETGARRVKGAPSFASQATPDLFVDLLPCPSGAKIAPSSRMSPARVSHSMMPGGKDEDLENVHRGRVDLRGE